MKSLKIILPVGIALCAIVAISTNNIRNDAETTLDKESAITVARNKAILSERQLDKDFEIRREQARRDEEFKRSLGLND